MSHSHTIYRNNPGTFLSEPFYDWRGHVFEELARHLSSRGMIVKVEKRKTFEVRRGPLATKQIAIRDSLAIIQNDHTGAYYAVLATVAIRFGIARDSSFTSPPAKEGPKRDKKSAFDLLGGER